MSWSWSILGDLLATFFLLAVCLRGPCESLLVLYGAEPTPWSAEKVDTLRRGVVVPYSEFGKTTPNSSSASSTTRRESIRFRFRSDPDRLLDALFSFLEGCGTLQAGVAWSKFQTRHHFITRVESESGSSGGGGM